MSGRTAARYDSGIASAAESEPLFSAEDGDDIGDGENATWQDGHGVVGTGTQNGNSTPHYPPPRYLKSTFSSREYEYDASDDVIDPEAEDQTRDLPIITGLLQTARSRGSVDVHRNDSLSSNDHASNPEDAALGNGLIVGIGAVGGGILASVS